MKKYVDTHCHLDSNQYINQREKLLEEIEREMEFVVNIGYDLKSSMESIKIANNYKNIYAVVGIHPTEIEDEWTENFEKSIIDMGQEKKVVAIGEIGLDYHWMTKEKKIQEKWFRKQLEIARKISKPVVIHSRDAIEDTIKILKDYPDIRGIIHCYPGSYETALEINSNFIFGIAGVVTFKNSKKLVEMVKKIPLNRLVIETDAPYLTPEPHRGKINYPKYVEFIVKKIAEIKGVTKEEVLEITTKNAREIYNIV